jgi:hypothetical protein
VSLSRAERGRELALLTGAKWVSNVALRWVSAVSGRLYEAYGIGGSLVWVSSAACLAIVMATLTTTGLTRVVLSETA